jgi:PPOX class probable F420-dependent enzyme
VSTEGTDILSAEARDFAQARRVGHLATADAAGMPHVVPFCYALVGNQFYFVVDDKPKRTRTGLKRLRNLRGNPRVAFVIDDYDDDWDRLAFLLVQGEAAVVTDAGEFARALAALRERYAQYWGMSLRFGDHPMVRISPLRCHLWRARSRAG